MKKLFITLMMTLLVASVAHAQGAKSNDASSEKVKKNLIEKTEGKITSIVKANKARGEFGGFSVITDGKTKEFKLLAKTHCYSAKESSPIAFEDLKNGDPVTVLSVVSLKGYNNVVTVTKMQ